jgi:hypothetical protein
VDSVDRKVADSGEKAARQSAGFAERIKGQWLGVSAAVYSAYRTAVTAFDLGEAAANYQQSRQAFRGMVRAMGRDAEQEFARIKAASAGLIPDNTLVEATNRAMSLGIPIQHLGALIEISRAKARDMGISMTYAFDSLVTGIGRASPLMIDNLGISLKIGEANAAYARSIHKTVDQLTEQDRKMAVLNATIEAGTEALGRHNLEILTQAEKYQAFKVQGQNILLFLGDIVNRAFALVAGSAKWLAAGLFGLLDFLGRGFEAVASIALFALGGIIKGFDFLSAGALIASDYVGRFFDATEAMAYSTGAAVLDFFSSWLTGAGLLAKASDKVGLTDNISGRFTAWAETVSGWQAKMTAGAERHAESAYKPGAAYAAGMELLKKPGGEAAVVLEQMSMKLGESAEQTGRFWEYAMDMAGEAADNLSLVIGSQSETTERHVRAVSTVVMAELDEVRDKALGTMDAIEDALKLAESRMQAYMDRINEVKGLLNETNSLMGGDLGRGMSMMTEGMLDFGGVANSQMLFDQQIEALKRFHEEEVEAEAAKGAKMADLQQKQADFEMQLDGMMMQRKMQMYAATANMAFGALFSIMAVTKSSQKSMFYAQQAYALTMAGINIAQGVTAALAAGPGFAWMIPVIKGIGAAQIAAIAAATLMGPPSVPSASMAGSGPGSTSTTPGGIAAAEPAPAREPNIVVNVYPQNVFGQSTDDVARDIYTSVEKLRKDGLTA